MLDADTRELIRRMDTKVNAVNRVCAALGVKWVVQPVAA